MIALLAAAAFAAPVDVSKLRAPYARVQLPAAIDPTARGDYGDLRVRDDRGREVPYAVDPHDDPEPLVVTARAAGGERPAEAPDTQRVSVDLGTAHVSVAAVRVDAATPAFARDVVVQRSDDGESWTEVAEDRLVRYRNGTAHLQVDTRGARARLWRVVIDDRDDAPLAGVRVTMLSRAHEIVFPVERGRRYALSFGDPALEAPAYDLPYILRVDRRGEARAFAGRIVALNGAAGPEQRLPLPPSAPSERRRNIPAWVPALAFTLTVAVLAWFALRLVRTAHLPEPRGG